VTSELNFATTAHPHGVSFGNAVVVRVRRFHFSAAVQIAGSSVSRLIPAATACQRRNYQSRGVYKKAAGLPFTNMRN
jgi:hypothetical protein